MNMKTFKHPDNNATFEVEDPNLYILYERAGFVEVKPKKGKE